VYKKPIVIGFLGRAASGKTTSARYLNSLFGGKILSLAYPLKAAAKVLWKFTDDQMYGDQKIKEAVDPRIGKSPRYCMEMLGRAMRESGEKDFWIKSWMLSVQKEITHQKNNQLTPLILVDDLRYANEVSFVANNEEFQGYVVKLSRTDIPPSNNPSEAEIDSIPNSQLLGVIESHASEDALHLKKQLNTIIDKLLLGSSERIYGLS
jgi:hypothetical protein